MPIPGYYKIRFTDPASRSQSGNVGSFIVEPFTTNGYDRPTGQKLDSHATSADTDLVIPGKGVPSYGELIAEDVLHMLENFSSAVPPSAPIHGQLWVKTGTHNQITAYSNATPNNITVSGDIVDRVQEIIDNFPLYPAVPEKINLRFICADQTDELIRARPVSVTLSGPNTVITFVTGQIASLVLPKIPSLVSPYKCFIVTEIKRESTICVYNLRRDLGETEGSWKNIKALTVSGTEPDLVDEGELWIDTSGASANLKFITGGVTCPGFLRLDGGTLTGPLILPEPTQDGHAATRKYVDDLFATAVLYDDTAVLADIVTLQQDVDNLEIATASIPTIESDITTLQSDLTDKYDKTGGVVSGTVSFNTSDVGNSEGIRFDGTSNTPGHDYLVVVNGTSTTTNLQLNILEPTGSEYSAFSITHKKGGDASETKLQVRENEIISSVGIYQQDADSLAFGISPTPKQKYTTGTEFDSNLNSVGTIVNNLSFSDLTMTLTADRITWDSGSLTIDSQDVDISHTHSELVPGLGYEFEQGAPGSYTWTKPLGFADDDTVIFRLVGAGGSGGCVRENLGTNCAASGGAGGAFIERSYRYSTVPSTVSYAVGTGGAAITLTVRGDAPGIAGTSTSAIINTEILIANGGAAGSADRGGTSIVGSSLGGTATLMGIAVPSSVLYNGGDGGSARADSPLAAESGGSSFWGSGGGGGGATNGSTQITGTGGVSVNTAVGGNGAAHHDSGAVPVVAGSGQWPGGGGGGAAGGGLDTGVASTSGAGADGTFQVLIIRGYVPSFLGRA